MVRIGRIYINIEFNPEGHYTLKHKLPDELQTNQIGLANQLF